MAKRTNLCRIKKPFLIKRRQSCFFLGRICKYRRIFCFTKSAACL